MANKQTEFLRRWINLFLYCARCYSFGFQFFKLRNPLHVVQFRSLNFIERKFGLPLSLSVYVRSFKQASSPFLNDRDEPRALKGHALARIGLKKRNVSTSRLIFLQFTETLIPQDKYCLYN